jgi:[acyl-carrier-protein] S-malonyltransferase
VLSADDAIRLTRVRGAAMAASCGATPTGMTAVLGGDEATVLGALAEAGLTPANINATGQIVAGGTLEQLAEFAANPPKGARLRPLRVAGAFHTKHMAPAVDALEAAAAGTTIKDPMITLLSNPVRWDLCMATMSDIGVTALIELLPGGTLTGMAKRALPGVDLLAIKTPDQLDAARALIAAHGTSTNGYAAAAVGSPEWKIVVASGAGTVRLGDIATGAAARPAGATVHAGDILGHIIARGGEKAVTVPDDAVPHESVVTEWLVEDGDPVGEGQPLVRLERKEQA